MSMVRADAEQLRKRRVIGRRLRALRQEAGVTGAELSVRSGIERTRISRIENGRGSVTSPVVRSLAEGLSLSPEQLRALLLDVRTLEDERDEPGDGTVQTSQLALAELERTSTELLVHSAFWIPALFQSADYAAPLLSAVESLFHKSMADPDYDAEFEWLVRLRRQAELADPRKRFEFILQEHSLWRRPHASVDMAHQLHTIVRWAARPNISIYVIMDGGLAAMDQTAYTLCDGVTVAYDTSAGWVRSSASTDIGRYQAFWDDVIAASLGPDESVKVLMQIRDEWASTSRED